MPDFFAQVIEPGYGGQGLTVWTIRLALICYSIFVTARLLNWPEKSWRFQRGLWTLGCGLFAIHVICAFQFVHGWSHSHALHETARQTNDVVGIDWGGGIFFNYAFTLIWILDVAWWWLHAPSYNRRPGILEILLHGFFLFIAFNATVVFESGPVRWSGLAALFAICVATGIRIREKQKQGKQKRDMQIRKIRQSKVLPRRVD